MIEEVYDLAIIGGGINGTGIAADASHRGLKVLLCEKNDLANATSSASSKLIHGGLRYLEYGKFKLVRESLIERNILQRVGKHLVKPLLFVLPHHPTFRSKTLIRLGMFIYNHLAKTTLPHSKYLNLQKHQAKQLLKSKYKYGFQYSDCQVDDSRLVITNALSARKSGACILNYCECINAIRNEDSWIIRLKNNLNGQIYEKKARVLINATGPWVEKFLLDILETKSSHQINLVKGCHIVVPRLCDGNFAYIMQNKDGRVIFLIPYLSKYHLIGTTENFFSGNLDSIEITSEEIDYLLSGINQYINIPVKAPNIIHTFSGVRPLLQDNAVNPTAISRNYALELNTDNNLAPLVSVFGGKITTYRKLSEKVIDLLHPFFKGIKSCETATTCLPGSNYQEEDDHYFKFLEQKNAWVPTKILRRYFSQYGTDTLKILDQCHSHKNLGNNFGADLYQIEVDYLVENEWAKNATDILWRRTKLGYAFPSDNLANLNLYIQQKLRNLQL